MISMYPSVHFSGTGEDIRTYTTLISCTIFPKKVYYIDFDGQPVANERILEAF